MGAAVETAEAALRDRLVSRELSVEYSEEPVGVAGVELTMNVHHLGLAAYYTYRLGLNAPEHAVMGCLLRRVYALASRLRVELEEAVRPPPPRYFDFLGDLEAGLARLGALRERFPAGACRGPLPTDPWWLREAFAALSVISSLSALGLGEVRAGEAEEGWLIRVLLWRLYELYVFYLVVRYLEGLGLRVVRDGGRGFVVKAGERRVLRLLFNAPISGLSSLQRVDDEADVERYMGRPDVSVVDGRPVIFECKYSSDVAYITGGRFKVMAYAYEYDPLAAVLAYPGLKKGARPYDEEDGATMGLDALARERGYVEFQFRGRPIYVALIDPLRDDEENLRVIGEVLGRHVDALGINLGADHT